MKARTLLFTVALLGLLVGLSYAAGPAQRSNRGPGRSAALVPLTQTEIDHIIYLREEEKMARDVYLALADMWDCPIFTNISASEQRHMDAIERLIIRHGLTDPVTDDTPGTLANPELQVMYSDLVSLGAVSLLDALNVGKASEEQDIADLTVALSEVTAGDVTRVFENLLRGSNNHLAAFDRAIAVGCTATCDDRTYCGMAVGAGNCLRDGNGPQGLAGQGRARRGKGNGSSQGDRQQSRQRKRDGGCAPTQ